ncbi:ABC transporter substrate-binding protein [Streptomyces adonidis]|uniref:nSTAND3 domain-containing NTPase n=1 Tax=Streptomyces adonidis TaxID=3231367 RepID=UPI0034DB77B5
MTDTFGSYVGEAYGSVHTGPGNQFNFYLRAAEERLREQASRRPRAIAKEDREHLAKRFVNPPHMQRARDRLREKHTVLIDGRPGSGRRTAAIMLLHELSEVRGTLHELPDTSDDSTASPLDPREINEGDRLLLDLSEAEESSYLAVQNTLLDFRSTLIARGARLVVVLPQHLGYLLRGDLRHLTVEIGRPSPQRVLTVYLRLDDITPPPDELSSPALTAYLPQAPIRDVAALADRIGRCRDVSPADRGFPHWLAESLDGQHDQAERVAADFSAERSGRHRALLLSVAMFHGATPATVLQAANALLDGLSHPPDDTPRLARADLRAELSEIGADTQPDGRVRFGIPGYDNAVREHFWTFLPDIHRQLRDWFRRCLAEPVLDASGRKEAVVRFAVQSLRTARPEDLTWLADRWTSGNAPAHLTPEAAQVLALGLDDGQHGRFFRQRIYDWATSTDTGNRLREVLVVVCVETMARTHPDQALVRLHHLARRAGGPMGANARAAVLELARSDHRLYRRMLDRLASGVAQGHWATDRDLFLELGDPVRLIGFRSVREPLTVCWAGVLGHPVDSWGAPLRRWLTACEDIRHRDLVLRVLATACAPDPPASGRVYRAALSWLRADRTAERADVVGRLLYELNVAQGIEPYGYAV